MFVEGRGRGRREEEEERRKKRRGEERRGEESPHAGSEEKSPYVNIMI